MKTAKFGSISTGTMRAQGQGARALGGSMSRAECWRVSYAGFLRRIVREFPSRARAEQWARQVGVYSRATIIKVPE